MPINLDFANNAILSCFFLFFLVIELNVLIPAAIAQSFHPIAELINPLVIPIKEAKAETEIHQKLT